MRDIVASLNASRFPLIEDRTKGAKLLGIIIVGRALRDVIIPANSQMGRSMYAVVVAGVMLYLLARPAIPRARAALWAVLGGLVIAAVMAL